MNILNKNQFKNNIDNISIKRIYNFENDNKIVKSSIGNIVYKQSNAFKVKYDTLDKELWIYYDSIEIKDNKIYYYNYISEYDTKKEDFADKTKNISLIPLTDKEKEKMNKGNNHNYLYKYIIMINEIIEVLR